VSIALKHVPCDVPEIHDIYAKEEQIFLEPWLQFLSKCLQLYFPVVEFFHIFVKHPTFQVPKIHPLYEARCVIACVGNLIEEKSFVIVFGLPTGVWTPEIYSKLILVNL
jgi:hypothetical protein